MPLQIRLSSIVLAVLISAALVAGMILLRPPLTQQYYVQMAGLIAGAGLVVTLYNRAMTARARRRAAAAPAPAQETLPAESAVQTAEQVPAYAETAAAALPDTGEVQADAPPHHAAAAEEALPERLDALLDLAYETAAAQPARAIAAYRYALARYPGDSYMPYLVIELSTLYKQRGDYAAALALFDEALALPIIVQNTVMAQEFRRSRRALAAVSQMLAARGTPALPFGDVPKEVLSEADRLADGQRDQESPHI